KFFPSEDNSHRSLPLLPTLFLVNRSVLPSGDQRYHHRKFPGSAKGRAGPPLFGLSQIFDSWVISKSPFGIQLPSAPVMSGRRLGVPPNTGKPQSCCSISAPVKLPTRSSDLSLEMFIRLTLGRFVGITTVSPPLEEAWATTKRPP